MKKLFVFKGIVAAIAAIFALSLASCSKDDNGPERPAVSNFKTSYALSDYYQWDAYATWDKEDTGTWELNSSHFHNGNDVKAEQSCKDCPTAAQMRMYLGAGVYWDENGPEYTLPDSKTYKTGLWVMKSSKIKGFNNNTASMKDKVSFDDGTNLFQVGKPANTSDYFFLPANGYYRIGSKTCRAAGIYGDYWSSTSGGSESYYFDFGKKEASVINSSRNDGIFIMHLE